MQTLTAELTRQPLANLLLRPSEPTPEDYAAMVDVHNAVWPDHPTTAEGLENEDKHRDPRHFFDRWLAEIDGRVIAMAKLRVRPWAYAPGNYELKVAVHPSYRHRGIGSILWQHLYALAKQRGAVDLAVQVRADQVEAIRFAEKRCYRQVMRIPRSILNVSAFDPAPFQARVEGVKAGGIAIFPLRQLMESDPDWQQKIYELECDIMADVPMPEPFTPQPIDQYLKNFSHPNFMAEGWMIGVDNGHYAGLSCLWRDTVRTDKLWTGLTGTRREYRRKGLATALKVAAICYAQEAGIVETETENEENNPMFQINLQLGFQPAPAYLAYHLSIQENDAR